MKEKDVITAPLLAGKQTRKGNFGDFEKIKAGQRSDLWPALRWESINRESGRKR